AGSDELRNNILLNANENPYPPPQRLSSCPNREWDTDAYNYYPQPQPRPLLTALAALYNAAPEQLIVGRGSDEGIDLLIRAFCDPQDAVAVCTPTFGVYRSYAEIQGCRILELPLEIKVLRPRTPNRAALLAAKLPVAALQRAIANEAPKLLFVPNQLAPLGTMIPAQELEQLLELCSQHDVLLVVDEAYAEFAQVLEPAYQSCIPLQEKYPHLAVLRTLSKAYSLAGERIGTLLAAPELVQLLRPIQAPYPVPASIGRYVSALLEDRAALQSMALRLEELCAQHHPLFSLLESLPYVESIYTSAANFIMVQAGSHGEKLLRHCRRHGLILRDFTGNLQGALRISLGNAPQMEQLAHALRGFAPVV
ncbi:MAG: aminotransferase class I/II-fold pyridoxal phosphate-dependent enzyme, partial [Spirochaetota bacterium]